MATELNAAPARSLWLVRWAAPRANTRSSLADPVGAMPPAQFRPVLQLLSPPPPVQLNVAGVSRTSSSSHRRVGNGRRRDGVRDDQPVHRRPRTVLDMKNSPDDRGRPAKMIGFG